MTLGEARIAIRANLGPLRSGLRTARRLLDRGLTSIARSAMRGVTNMISSVMRTIITTIRRTVKIAIAAFVAIGIASVKMASDIQESENLFDVAMGGMAKATREWSDELSESLGLSSFAVRKMTGRFFLMFKAYGLSAEKASENAKSITELTHDMASFFNLSFDESFAKITSGLAGMVRPLRTLGILVGEGAVMREALSSGLIANKRELTDLEKLQLRINILFKQTTEAQGDLLRTIDNLQNRMRILKAAVERAGVAIGNVFINDVAGWTKSLTEWSDANIENIKAWAGVVREHLLLAVGYFQDLFDLLQNEGWHAALSKLGVDIQNALKITLEIIRPQAEELGKMIGRGFLSAVSSLGKTAGSFVVQGAINRASDIHEVGSTQPREILSQRANIRRMEISLERIREDNRNQNIINGLL